MILRHHIVDSPVQNILVCLLFRVKFRADSEAALKADRTILSYLVSYYYTVRSDDIKVLKSRWNFLNTKTKTTGNNISTMLITWLSVHLFKFYFLYKLLFPIQTLIVRLGHRWLKGLGVAIHSCRKSVIIIIIYTSQNFKPLHRAIGSPIMGVLSHKVCCLPTLVSSLQESSPITASEVSSERTRERP